MHGQGHSVNKGVAKVLGWAAEIEKQIEYFLGKSERPCNLTPEQMALKMEEIYHIQLDTTERGLLQLHFKEILETLLLNLKALKQHSQGRARSPEAAELKQQVHMQFVGLIRELKA